MQRVPRCMLQFLVGGVAAGFLEVETLSGACLLVILKDAVEWPLKWRLEALGCKCTILVE